MRSILSIRLPKKILNELRSEARRGDASAGEIVRKALREYFFKAGIERIRKEIRKQGIRRGKRGND